MKTYPILRADGSLRAFEISSTWIHMGTICRLLGSVPGTSEIRRVRFGDQRMLFRLHGEQCAIWEPWGDSSRYWIGPSNAKLSQLNLSELHAAFAEYTDVVTATVRRIARLGKGPASSFSAYLGILIGMLIFRGILSGTAVAFVIPQQAQILSLPSILVAWALGWVGVLLGERAGFPPLVDAGISNRQRLLIPALIGMAIGVLAVLMDLIQPLGGQIQIKFPASLLVYPLGGVIEEIIFRLFLTTLLVWLVSNVFLRGRYQVHVFWVVVVLVGVLYTIVAQLGAYQALRTITPLLALRFGVVIGFFSIIAAYLYRKYGFLAAIAVRLGQYLIWHIVWGR